MVAVSRKVKSELKKYVDVVSQEVPINCTYLFGSYAKGTQKLDSDVDVCFFSDHFDSRKEIDMTAKLVGLSRPFDLYIEPHIMSTTELTNGNPFAQEILRSGQRL